MTDEKIRLVFDMDLGRPACAILQAAMGGDHLAVKAFDPGTWLTAPTDGMKGYLISRSELEKVAALVNFRAAR